MQNVYAALLLHKLGKGIDEEGMKKVLQAAGATGSIPRACPNRIAIDCTKLTSFLGQAQEKSTGRTSNPSECLKSVL